MRDAILLILACWILAYFPWGWFQKMVQEARKRAKEIL